SSSTVHIFTLSLHDALPIWPLYSNVPYMGLASVFSTFLITGSASGFVQVTASMNCFLSFASSDTPELLSACFKAPSKALKSSARSEEHTSELQSRENLVCRL